MVAKRVLALGARSGGTHLVGDSVQDGVCPKHGLESPGVRRTRLDGDHAGVGRTGPSHRKGGSVWAI